MSDVMSTMAPVVGRVRAYFAPVARPATQTTGFTLFDPAQNGAFDLGTPPAPWIDLGWIANFARKCGTKIEPIRIGTPAATQMQVRTEIDVSVSFCFESWRKLQLAISAGTQQMNLLKTTIRAIPEGSGGLAITAVPVGDGSSATVLQIGPTAAAAFAIGELVAVDVDYTNQIGFVGSGVSGAYVQAALTDVDYIRRVTLNVSRITSISEGAMTLECRRLLRS